MIPAERSHIHVAAITHPGMSGKNNEDNYAVSAHHMSPTDPTPSVFAVLADGVGGHQAGEVASEIATETISEIIQNSDGLNPLKILEYAITQANQKVAGQSVANDNQLGMGSTCSCVWIIDDRAYTVSVGDSRIYFIRGESIRQVTTDHTWVQEAIEHGIITPEQAQNHPRAHVIRRYLGSKKPIQADFRLRLSPDETDEQALANQGLRLQPGDQLIICSDGLTDLVQDFEILETIQTNNMDEAIKSLVDSANERGGHDNITIVYFKVPEPKEDGRPKDTTRVPGISKLSWQIYLLISIIIIVVVSLITVLYFYFVRAPSRVSPTPTIAITEPIQTLPEPTLKTTQGIDTIVSPTITFTETTATETFTPWPTNTETP